MARRDVADHPKSHFDEIAEKYDEEMPRHIREHLCVKKVYFIMKKLKEHHKGAGHAGMRGLDCGCGTGWHVKRFCDEGFIVDGIDSSEKMIAEAKKNNNNNEARFLVSSVDNIPLEDMTYDFIYFINVLHHLPTFEAQQNALREAHRLLSPGGLLFINEVNEDFPLFKFYTRFIFPLTNKIHGPKRADRYWSIKGVLGFAKDNWRLRGIEYFTFLPNIIPAFAFSFFKNIEAFLEKSVKYKFGAHWLLTLERAPVSRN